MRVLIVHNDYRSSAPSGENAAVDRDASLLRAAGNDVRELRASSDGTTPATLLGAGLGIRSRGASRALHRTVAEGWRPDVLHMHNLFPLLTTGPIRLAARLRIPLVTTAHNYRRTCAAGTHFRAGGICEDCTDRSVAWPAVAHACYRGSPLQTLPVVLNQRLDRSVWNGVDAAIALTPYMRERLVAQSGMPPDRVVVRPTAVEDPGAGRPGNRRVLFVGRLSAEKGVGLLLEAWRRASPPPGSSLRIAGDGPEREEIERLARTTAGVRFLGRLDAAEVADEMRRAAVVVTPSLWYEGFPTVVAEAFAHGRPVIACDNPNMRSVVADCGWLVPPRAEDLATAITAALTDADERVRLGQVARERYLREMTQESSLRTLLTAYGIAADRHRAERAACHPS